MTKEKRGTVYRFYNAILASYAGMRYDIATSQFTQEREPRMNILDLIAELQAIADTQGDVPVFIDSGEPHVSHVEIDQRDDEDGPWVALVTGSMVWA